MTRWCSVLLATLCFAGACSSRTTSPPTSADDRAGVSIPSASTTDMRAASEQLAGAAAATALTAATIALATTVLPTTVPTTALPTTVPTTVLPTTVLPTTVLPTTVLPTTLAGGLTDAEVAEIEKALDDIDVLLGQIDGELANS